MFLTFQDKWTLLPKFKGKIDIVLSKETFKMLNLLSFIFILRAETFLRVSYKSRSLWGSFYCTFFTTTYQFARTCLYQYMQTFGPHPFCSADHIFTFNFESLFMLDFALLWRIVTQDNCIDTNIRCTKGNGFQKLFYQGLKLNASDKCGQSWGTICVHNRWDLIFSYPYYF